MPALGRIIPRRLPPFIAYDSWGIFLVRPDGSDSHLVVPPPSPTATTDPATEPSWSPRATRILYQVGCAIWVVKADGSDQRLVIPEGGPWTRCGNAPHWSPDGRRILYVGSGPLTEDYFIRIASVDGSHDHPVGDTEGAESASFSPDGHFILFDNAYPPSNKPRVYVMRPNGTGLRPVTPRGQVATDPSWSPDGTRIIYSCSFYVNPVIQSTGSGGPVHRVPRPVPHALCEISRTHPKPRTLYSVPSGSYFGRGTWSADGRTIVLTVDDGDTLQIALMSPRGGAPVEITHPPSDIRDPDW